MREPTNGNLKDNHLIAYGAAKINKGNSWINVNKD